MKITVNGKDVELAAGITIAEMLKQQGLNPAVAVVEYNGIILKQDDLANKVIQHGDNLEIVTFVGGG